MNGFLRNPFRVLLKFAWLLIEISLSAIRFFPLVLFAGGQKNQNRTKWLQASSRRVLQVFDLSASTFGPIPESGFLICNHLSYLDVLALSATTPCIFIAKKEIRNWPVLGWLARQSGCLFIDRKKRGDVARLNGEIHKALRAGLLLVLFPEGTSSDGRSVLPFKSSLLEPIINAEEPIYAGKISYRLADGDVHQEVCYWGDMTLVPHVINLLSRKNLQARLDFSRVANRPQNRKILARQLHSLVSQLGSTIDEHALKATELVDFSAIRPMV